MALTDKQVQNAEIDDERKLKKLTDGHGLYLLINKSGKYWRYEYKFNGKRKTYAIGAYPAVPLAGKTVRGEYIEGARDILTSVKKLIKQGVDPNQLKQEQRKAAMEAQEAIVIKQAIDTNTFEKLAREWHAVKEPGWSAKHARTIMRRFENHVFPFIGAVPVAELHKTQIADVITNIVSHGTIEIATRIGQIIRQVLEYCCDKGLIELAPMGNVKSLIPARKVKPMPAITDPDRVKDLLAAIDVYNGTYIVCQALKLWLLVGARPGEFRKACWNEFNLKEAVWTIPAKHRKLIKFDKEDIENTHTIPLSTQAVKILEDIHRLTGTGNHVFPSARGDARPMSENTLNCALQAMGFKDEIVAHGLRSMYSTAMNEAGFNPDAIERHLSHGEKNKVRAAYNRGEYAKERGEMIQAWADYLDKLKSN